MISDIYDDNLFIMFVVILYAKLNVLKRLEIIN